MKPDKQDHMTLVKCKEDVDKIRPYKEHYDLTVYPKRYPAFVEFVDHDGGICGGYYTMDLLEIPASTDARSFIAGVQSNPKSYSEKIFKKKQTYENKQ